MPLSGDTPEARAYRLFQHTILVCAGLIIGVVVLFLLFAVNTSNARCHDTQDIRSYILQATQRSLTATPTLDYYKQHPDELKDAVESLERQRDTFRDPLDCSLF